MKKETSMGVLLIGALSLCAWWIAKIPCIQDLSLSSLIIGILLGMIFANTLRPRTPVSWEHGFKFCSKRMLRLGIILYGFRLTFQDVMIVGASALIVDVIVVAGTLLLGLWLGHLLKMDRETTLLTATGSAICGAAAVLGAEPVVKAAPHKTAIAVSTVVIFGTISMFLYPILYRSGLLGLSDTQMGIYTGATLHEVAHVVGAGNAMGSDVATTALIVKMVRVILLVPVLLLMSALLNRGKNDSAHSQHQRKITVPWFAFLFLAMIGVNSLLHSALPGEAFAPGAWMHELLQCINLISTFMLTMAMTALGADTGLNKFRQAGAKPFVLAALLYIWLVGGGYLLIRCLL
jgi:uncharacterized integral membrane protein (TIGR00698 family)